MTSKIVYKIILIVYLNSFGSYVGLRHSEKQNVIMQIFSFLGSKDSKIN